MKNRLQLAFNVATKKETENAWAFAMDKRSGISYQPKKQKEVRKRRSAEDYRTYVIIACSKQAKALGVQVGMRYHDALQLVPGMRIMAIGNQQR
jgi:nucleotidyltransferase/DNA polymerase involved in DNA repair